MNNLLKKLKAFTILYVEDDKGNFATAGFVDFKTKDFLENNFAKLEVGQFKTYRGVLGLNLLKTPTLPKEKI
jgi:hypothetical protein